MDRGRIREEIGRVTDRLPGTGGVSDQSSTGDRALDIEITGISEADLDESAAVLTAAFRPENFTTAAFGGNGDPEQAGFEAFVRAILSVCLAQYQPLFVARERDTSGTDDIVGVAILRRPGRDISTRTLVRSLLSRPRDAVSLLRVCHPHDTRRVRAAHSAPSGLRERNYTLEYIGVHPDRQGEGIGGRLLDVVHDFTDRDPGASGVYLATAGEYTRDIYADYGYETVEIRVEERLDPDGGPLRAWHMQRPPDGH